MAKSDIDNIKQDLIRRFEEPLKDSYKRRIVFWYDEEKEFEEDIDTLYIPNVKILHLTGNNFFNAKKTLCEDDTTSNYLVYSPLSFENDDDNWLINVQLYSEEYRADQLSIWINEMEMPSNPTIRELVKKYRKFFNSKERRLQVKNLNLNYRNPSQMPLAIMAVLSNRKDISPAGIIRAVITKDLDINSNTIYQSFVAYNMDSAFWSMVTQATGFNKGADVSLFNLIVHILLTASSKTMETDVLAGLNQYLSVPHQSFCYDLVNSWLHSDDKNQIYELSRNVERKLRLIERFNSFDVLKLLNTECFPCIDECILTSLMKNVSENENINVNLIKDIIARRRTAVWYEKFAHYYNGLQQVANMQEFYLNHAEGFHLTAPKEVWNAYKDDYYLMDTYYRLFHLNFQESLSKFSNPTLDDLFKQVAEKIEGLYTNWFLVKLGENWTKASEECLKNTGRIDTIPHQTNFYASKIENAQNKVFVIISDALRYEVAVSLAEKLKLETQSEVNVKACTGIFPTITKFGMAALLPHKELTVNDKLDVLADGMSTNADNRDTVLKTANSRSVALKYDDLVTKTKADRQALIKGMDVVYIYHDKIDETSHASENEVFKACNDTIGEIINLVKIIINSFGSTNILITSDHGFLYTYRPLNECDKISKSEFKDVVEYGRRYVITKKNASINSLMPITFLNDKTDYSSFAPRENLRIKKSGSGENFVHGGTSLQEIMVPIIEYHYLRNSYKSYQDNREDYENKPVELDILSSSRKVSNMIFSLEFYQKEAVKGNITPATFRVYFEDEFKNKISDVSKIIADKTSDNEQERKFKINFNLRSQAYSNLAKYYLIIEDESGIQVPKKIEFNIDIALAVDEFNFF